ncbi:MAG TPA: DUF397 domain-containing protein [Trebonia sp.]|nr:DUF397 domain-containing protein [Trebonia sp.]
MAQDYPELLGWRKARRSMANGNCVEVRPADGAIAVRDSKNPNGDMLAYGAASWRVFTSAVRQGRFDTN